MMRHLKASEVRLGLAYLLGFSTCWICMSMNSFNTSFGTICDTNDEVLASLNNDESPSFLTQERNQTGEILAIRDDDGDDDGSTGYTGYKPASLEQYFMENMGTLGLNWTISGYSAYTCHIFTAAHVTNQDIFDDITSYTKDLDQYAEAIQKFEPIPDLLREIQTSNTNQEIICKNARPVPQGIESIFTSKQLSHSESGFIDPLLPSLRHPKICQGDIEDHITSIDYLVHDFEAMCRKLKPTSRRVFIDMGASLDFHGEDQPVVKLLDLYEKFGFHFDHIYAFEITPSDAEEIYTKLLPKKYVPSYHWINAGVTWDKGGNLNPLYSILTAFNEDDFIVVKLDIDTPQIEIRLAKQLLDDDQFGKLVDQFYFEHHVYQREMAGFWGGTMKGTVKDSFDLFYGLREKGIAAHHWV